MNPFSLQTNAVSPLSLPMHCNCSQCQQMELSRLSHIAYRHYPSKSKQLLLISEDSKAKSNHIIYPSPFLISNTETNEMESTNGIYQCLYCPQSYIRYKDFRKHMMKHENKERPFLCFCGKSFAKQHKMKKHQMKRHPFNRQSISQPIISLTISDIANTRNDCNTNTKRDTTPDNTTDDDDSYQEESVPQKRKANELQLIPILNFYYCPICDKMFTKRLRHKQHIVFKKKL